FDVAQLAARDVADAGPLDLDHVGAHIGEQLRAGRARLDVGEIEDAHAVERLAGLAVWFGRGLGQAVRQRCRAFGHDLRRLLRLELHDLLAGGLLRRRLLPSLGRCLALRHVRPRHLYIVWFLVTGAYSTPWVKSRISTPSGAVIACSLISCEPRFAG